MATVVIISNLSTVADVLIADVGVFIPSAGGQETFDFQDELQQLQQSIDLRELLVDDAFGAGSSTLILNDGTSNIAQADALNYLDTVRLPDGSENYGVLQTNGLGQVDQSVTFDGSATVTGLILGGDANANGNQITGLPAPVNPGDAANRQFVLDNVQGLDVKESVRALADTNIVLTGTQTIDGVALTVGDRVLLNGQTTGSENGIWEVQSGAWTRPTDFATGDTVASAFTFVEEGTVYADTGWVCTNDQGSDVVDTDALSFSQFSGAGSIVAGAGLTKTGSTIDVGAGNGIIVNPDDIEVAYGLVGDIQDVGAANAAGVANLAARADHVHDHGDRGGDGTISQHDADQIDVEGTYTAIGAPDNLENVLANIDALFLNGGARDLNFGLSRRVPASGTRFMTSPDSVQTSSVPIRLISDGNILAGSIQVDVADSTNSYKLSIRINAAEVALVNLPSGNLGAVATGLNVAFSANDLLSVAVVRTGGSGRSDFRNVNAVVEYNYN